MSDIRAPPLYPVPQPVWWKRGREAQPGDQPRTIDRIERYEKREGPELQTHLAFRPLPDSPPSAKTPAMER
ncbi:hypothetical protein CNYM01_09088 [Colletotrichum nymphaeae SA-01]|uniref:Uncharacterized protein n=1 Tax=Colletotrichum nymphaeae SA-01 TaxID=1460502 RepID=A0A135SMR5_9PEZI|nr:hypothetical protein CNYM01_09088 [Colletotrichum nymphaeae SA-01]